MVRSFRFKKPIYIFSELFLLVLLIIGLLIKCIYFHHKLPTKSIKLDDIKSIQIINLDRAKERRANYEKMLHDNFGSAFMGREIDDKIRLSGVDGKKEIIFENLVNGKKYKYDDLKTPEKAYLILKNEKFKIYSEKDPKNYWYFHFTEEKRCVEFDRVFNIFGCNLSHWKAIENIAKQPDGTYGIIFEDDFLVEKDFEQKLQEILHNVPADFDALKLSLNQPQIFAGYKKLPLSRKHIITIMKSFRKYGYGNWIDMGLVNWYGSMTWGCQGYIISAEGARKIIEYTRNNLQYITTGNDNVIWMILPQMDVIKSYHYLQEMPIGLHPEDASNSQLSSSPTYMMKKPKRSIYGS